VTLTEQCPTGINEAHKKIEFIDGPVCLLVPWSTTFSACVVLVNLATVVQRS